MENQQEVEKEIFGIVNAKCQISRRTSATDNIYEPRSQTLSGKQNTGLCRMDRETDWCGFLVQADYWLSEQVQHKRQKGV